MSISLILIALVLLVGLVLILVGLVLILVGLILVGLILISSPTILWDWCWCSRPYNGRGWSRLGSRLGKKDVKRPHLLLLYAFIFGMSSSTIASLSEISFSPFVPNLNPGRSEFFRRPIMNLLGHAPIAGEWHPDDVLYAKQPFLGYKIPLRYLLALLSPVPSRQCL